MSQSLPTAAGKKKGPAIEPGPVGAGLKMAAHPLLLETTSATYTQTKADRYKPMQPKFASIKVSRLAHLP